jgi:ATP-dependent exoDNAse (exonuclease V) alpha subunit
MSKIEEDTKTRVFFTNEKGEREYKNESGEGIQYAVFNHHSSREQDMQMHSHIVIKNEIIFENKSYSIDAKSFYLNKMAYGKQYRLELANLLQKSGIEINIVDYKNFFFEIANIEKSDIEKFSKQSQKLQEKFEELKKVFPNRNESELRELANKETRKAKDRSKTIEELRENWKKELNKELNINDKNQYKTANNKQIDESLNIAKERLTEFKSYFNQKELYNAVKEELIKNKLIYSEESIKKVIDNQLKSKELVSKKEFFTSREIIEAENRIIEFAKNSHNKYEAILDKNQAKLSIENWQNQHFKLTAGQHNVLNSMLTSKNGVIVIQGDAGTGKTAVLESLNDILQDTKFKLIGLSTTGKAAEEIESASKIQSQTIDSFLIADKKNVENSIFIIDESSMNATKKLDEVIEHAQKINAKVVLQGDKKQLASIGAGGVFEYLQNRDYITYSEMTESIRQKNQFLKNVVKDIADGNIEQGLNKLNEAGKIIEIENKNEIFNQITDAYISEKNTNNIILANQNKDRNEINNIVRQKLINEKLLDEKQNQIDVLTSKNLSEYEKKSAYNYKENDVIIKGKHTYIVSKIDEKNNLLHVSKDGKETIIQPQRDLQIYNKEQKDFSINDKIVFLKNAKIGNSKVKNGQTAVIQNIEKNENGSFDITVMKDKKEIKFNTDEYKNFDFGYCITSYKSQGQTCEKVFIFTQGNETAENIYVQVSRAKQDALIFTNSKEKLFDSTDIHNRQISAKQFFTDIDKNNINNELNNDKKIDNTNNFKITRTVQQEQHI